MSIERWRNQAAEDSIADMSFEEQEIRRAVRPMPESMLTPTQRAALQEYIEAHLNGEHGQYEPQTRGKMDMDMIENLLLLDLRFLHKPEVSETIAWRIRTENIFGHGSKSVHGFFWQSAILKMARKLLPVNNETFQREVTGLKEVWESYGHIHTFLRDFYHARIAYPHFYFNECKEWVDRILESERKELIGMLQDSGTKVINPSNPYVRHLRVLSEESFQMVMEVIPPDMETFRQNTEDMVRRGNWYEALKDLANLKVMDADRVLVTDGGVICDYGQIEQKPKEDVPLPSRLKFDQCA